MLRGLNHITITVKNLEQSMNFYVNKLGFKKHVKWKYGAYLSIGDLWFCLSVGEPDLKTDYSHIAFDISKSNFQSFANSLTSNGITQWRQNTSEGQSLYILDPDGHKLEIHAGNLESRLKSLKHKPYKDLEWL